MLGTPCDARATCCQVKSLSYAASADWGDREDACAARGTVGRAGSGYPDFVRELAATCGAFEERAFGARDEFDPGMPGLKRWHAAVVARMDSICAGVLASKGRCPADARVAS